MFDNFFGGNNKDDDNKKTVVEPAGPAQAGGEPEPDFAKQIFGGFFFGGNNDNGDDEKTVAAEPETAAAKEEEPQEEEQDFAEKVFGLFFGKPEQEPMGLKRFGRERFPEQYPATTTEWALPLPEDSPEIAKLRPLLKNTNLEERYVAARYSKSVLQDR